MEVMVQKKEISFVNLPGDSHSPQAASVLESVSSLAPPSPPWLQMAFYPRIEWLMGSCRETTFAVSAPPVGYDLLG